MWSSGRVCVRVAVLPGILVVGFGAMRYGEDHTIATKWNRLLSQGNESTSSIAELSFCCALIRGMRLDARVAF